MDDQLQNPRQHVFELLGLDRFSLGYHGDRGETFIDHAWCADIVTAFHGTAILGVARAVDISIEPNPPAVWFRSAIAVLSESGCVATSEMVAIKSDALLGIDISINLFDTGNTHSRDGVVYTIYAPHYDGSIQLRFANPKAQMLKDAGERLLRIAQSIGSKTQNDCVIEFVSKWRTCSHSQA